MLTIRSFKQGDGEAVSRILYESFRSFLHERCIPRKPAEFYEQNARVHTDEYDRETFVAEIDGRLVGCLHIVVNEAQSAGGLWIIGIDPACHSRGIGRALFQTAAALWREKKIRSVTTCVSHINAKAISFYRKMGFRQVGLIRDQFIKGIDELQLEWIIDYPEGSAGQG